MSAKYIVAKDPYENEARLIKCDRDFMTRGYDGDGIDDEDPEEIVRIHRAFNRGKAIGDEKIRWMILSVIIGTVLSIILFTVILK